MSLKIFVRFLQYSSDISCEENYPPFLLTPGTRQISTHFCRRKYPKWFFRFRRLTSVLHYFHKQVLKNSITTFLWFSNAYKCKMCFLCFGPSPMHLLEFQMRIASFMLEVACKRKTLKSTVWPYNSNVYLNFMS